MNRSHLLNAILFLLTIIGFLSFGIWSVSAQSSTPVPFGMVHASTCDTALAKGGFLKTWWDKQGGADSLESRVTSDQACNQMQTPLIVANWDDITPAAIQTAMTNFFETNKNVPIWEMGIEENLNGKCCSSSQLSLLYDKFKAVKEARAAAGNPPVRIAYQIANMGRSPYQAFLNSTAAGEIDILAPHPYPWTDFPTPETWLDTFVKDLKGYIANSPTANKNMALMFTEVGAPVCDTDPAGCTMDENGPIRGQGQQENAEYMVKVHAMAFHVGVEKVYWYHLNSASGGSDPVCGPGSFGEDCFAMVNANGPRKAYYAYKTLTACMAGKPPVPVYRSTPDGLQVYEFTGSNSSCIIAWTYKNGVTEKTAPKNPILLVPMSSITTKPVISVLDTTGNPITYSGTLSPAPIFVQTQGTTPPPIPTVSLSASPTSVTSGQSSTLTWSSTNATSCTASGAWSGTKGTSGSQTITNLTTTGTYTLSCTGTGGTTAQSTTITVTTPPPSTDTTAPTTPTGLSATAVSSSQVNLNWTASTDPLVAGQTTTGISGYRIYRGGTQIATSPTTSYANTGLTSATTYSYTVQAVDLAGNVSPQSISASATTQTVVTLDTTPPTVSLTAPANNTTVGGTITVSGSATDTIGVAGIQFKLDNGNLGVEDTTSPYSITWNTTGATNGTHTLAAVARDAAGNRATSTASVTVSNTVVDTQVPTTPTNLSGTATSPSQIDLVWSPSTDNAAVTGYKVLVNGTQVATTTTTAYSHQNLSPFTTYVYTVSSYDATGNTGAPSLSLSVTTQAQVTTSPTTGGGPSASSGSSSGGSSGSTTGGTAGTGTTSSGSTTTSGTTSGGTSTETTTTAGTTTSTPSPTFPTLTGPFSVGQRGDQVTLLQEMLKKDGSFTGVATGYYGPITQEAVEDFQTKYNIVSSGSPATTGYGLAGPATRAKLNELYATATAGQAGTAAGTTLDSETLLQSLRKQVEELTKILQDLIAKLAALKAAQGR